MLDGVVAEELLNPLVARGTPWIDADTFWQDRIFEIGFVDSAGVDETLTGAENFFLPAYVTNGYQGIFPDLIPDPDGFYDINYYLVPALAPTRSFDDPDVFYAPDLAGKALRPTGLFIDTDIIYAPELRARVLPGLVVDDDIIRASVIRRDGDAIVLLLETFNDTDDIPAASLSVGVRPQAVIDSDVIYAPARFNFVGPTAFGSDDVFFAAFIFNQLGPHLVAADDVFVGPNVQTPGRMGLFVDNDVFFVPGVGLAPLVAPLVTDTDAFLRPVIASNPAMYPYDAVIDFADSVYAPNVIIFQSLAPYRWVDVDTIPSPAVIMGQVWPATFVIDADTVYAPILPPTLSPGVFSDIDAFLVPRMIYDQSLLTGAFTDTDVFYVPTIGVAVQFTRLLSASRAGLTSPAVIEDNSGRTRII